MSVNKVILLGNVGRDPEVRYLEQKRPVATFPLATNERASANSPELTEWHNITLFQKLADVADKYVRKGTMLYVEGSIHYRKWQGKDGVERFSTVITTDVMRILSGKAEQTEQAEPQYTPVQYPNEVTAPEVETPADDLPF